MSAGKVSVETAEVAGTATSTGAGAADAGSQRVVVAQDATTIAGASSLPSGSNTIGNVGIISPIGQQLMAASVGVVIASDQSAVPISAAALPLPAGAATSANQTTEIGLLTTIDADTGVLAGNTTVTQTLDSNEDIVVSMAGKNAASFAYAAGTLDATLIPFMSMNGGISYITANFISSAGVISSSVVLTNPHGANALGILILPGVTHVMVRVQTYNSGSAVAYINATNAISTSFGLHSWLGSTAPTIGQKTMASSLPVVIASNQSAVPMSASSLPLPTGASTSANQTTEIGLLTTIDADTGTIAGWNEAGRVAVNTIAGQIGVQGASGVVTALTQRVVLATDVALPTGSNTIGNVTATLSQTATTVAETSVNVAGADTTLKAANANRKRLTIQNHGSGFVRVSLSATATSTSPIRLVPGVGAWVLEGDFVYRGEVSAFSETGTNEVGVIEET